MPGQSSFERAIYLIAALLVIFFVVLFVAVQKDASDRCSQWYVDVAAHDVAPATNPDPGPNPC